MDGESSRGRASQSLAAQAKLVAAVDARMASITKWIGLRTIPLFLIGDHAPPQLLGSAVLVEMGGEHLLITAAHVATAPDLAPRMGLATPGAADGDLMRVIEHTRVVFSEPGRSGGHDDDPVDVAWLTLPDDHARMLRSRFHAIHIHDMAPVAPIRRDSLVMTFGFPEERAERVGERGLSTGGTGHLSRVVGTVPAGIEGFDPRSQLLVKTYSTGVGRGGVRVQMPRPTGMSGGGMWWIGNADDQSWLNVSRPARLIGTQHSWLKDTYMRGSRVAMALTLLYRHLPRVRPVLDLVR